MGKILVLMAPLVLLAVIIGAAYASTRERK